MHILLIEDNKKASYSLAFQLEKEGYHTECCYDGKDAFYYINETIYDLIILDRMLPNVDGMTILKSLRQTGNNTPVILLTALGELKDKVTGLDAGADDYLVKPFAFEELMARIRSIKRRPKEWNNSDCITFADLSFFYSQNALKANGYDCTLSKKEGELMEFLLQNPNQTLPRSTLFTRIWGTNSEVEEGSLDIYIHFLRRHLNSIKSRIVIKTVRGIGYRLEDSND